MVMAAIASLPSAQTLGVETRAGMPRLLDAEAGLVAIREDVGRHNALDKWRSAGSPLSAKRRRRQAAALSCYFRVSVEMVQKTAAIGASVLVASRPRHRLPSNRGARRHHAHRRRAADGFEVFTFPERLMMEAAENARESMDTAKLIRMANQIATFFRHEGEEAGAQSVKSIWWSSGIAHAPRHSGASRLGRRRARSHRLEGRERAAGCRTGESGR